MWVDGNESLAVPLEANILPNAILLVTLYIFHSKDKKLRLSPRMLQGCRARSGALSVEVLKVED